MSDRVCDARFSDCRRYRYWLRRPLDWQPGLFDRLEHERVVFVMLNPSTADERLDDPTIRRCMGFAQRERAGAVEVVNLYALRSPEPRALIGHPDPVGPDNDTWIRDTVATASLVIAAWGAFPYERMPGGLDRVGAVRGIVRDAGVTLSCLGCNRYEFPLHPLYLAKETPIENFA